MPLNKPQLVALSQENFPDNTQQLITPVLLREFNDEMINSMELTQSMDSYANLGTANIFYGGNQSIAKEYKLFTNGVYWNNNTAGYNNLEIINSITGNIDIAALGGGVRIVSSSLNITNGTFTASLAEGFTYVGNGSGRTTLVATSSFGSTINTGSFVSTSSFNAYTQSINSATASLFTSASLGLTTASFSGNTLTFTKGDASTFGVVIPDVSGSTIPAGTVSSSAQIVAYNIFATTGSNTFSGSQFITGGVQIKEYIQTGPNQLSLEAEYAIKTNGKLLGNGFTLSGSQATEALNIYYNGTRWQHAGSVIFTNQVNYPVSGAAYEGSGSIEIIAYGGGPLTLSGSNLTLSDVEFIPFSASLNTRILAATGSTIPAGTVSSSAQILNYNIFATTGSNTFVGNQTITSTGNTQINIESTGGPGSQQTNLDFRGNNSNFNAYGDFNIINNGQFGGSGSIKIIATKNNLSIASDSGIKIGATNGGGNGIDNGNISMQVRSGSLSLAPAANSNTTSSLLHLSSSSNTAFVNLIWKNSDNTNDTIISGSNNIFTNPGALTAGFKRYIGGNGNIIFAAGAVPQITGSMGYSPTMSQNYIGGAGGMIMRGPVSGSAWTISNNLINNTSAWAIGSTITFHAQQIVSGLTMTNNGGSVFPNIQAYKTPLSASFTYSTNTGAGTVVINCHSSSINMGGCISNGGTTINNSYFPVTSSINSTNGFVSVQNTLFIGGNNIFFSGSNSTVFTTPRAINASIIIGNNSASLNLLSDSGSLINTAIIGASLGVTGSNSFQLTAAIPSDWGSMFVGRNNAQDGGRAESAKNVFVVGTGTAAVKKTGFLIDSGSNSYFEGTLNVSGSTAMTGSLSVSGTVKAWGDGYDFEYGTYTADFLGGAFNLTPNKSISSLEMGANERSQIEMYANGGNYDTFKVTVDSGSNGTQFQDYPDATQYETWMKVGTSTTGNFGDITLYRNTNVTGSLDVSGSVNFATGSNKQAGTAVLDGANPGTVTVSNSLVTANSIIMVSKQTLTNAHMVAVSSKGAGTFTITSNGNGDADTVGWFIINNS